MITKWFDRDGRPITHALANDLIGDPNYRIVRRDVIIEPRPVLISTIWLGVDLGFGQCHAPMIFETLIVGGPMDSTRWRYSTEEAAILGHSNAVYSVRRELAREKAEWTNQASLTDQHSKPSESTPPPARLNPGPNKPTPPSPN